MFEELQNILLQFSDIERIALVISLCEKKRTAILNNTIYIENNDEYIIIENEYLENLWNRCWDKIKEEGYNSALKLERKNHE